MLYYSRFKLWSQFYRDLWYCEKLQMNIIDTAKIAVTKDLKNLDITTEIAVANHCLKPWF